MTNEQIATIIISATVSALVSSFAKPFTEKIFAAIMPDPKKIASFMTNAFFFILRYGPASFWVVWLLVKPLPFDKFWVLQFCIQFFILGILVSLDIAYSVFKRHSKITNEQFAITREQFEILKSVIAIVGEQATNMKNLHDVSKDLTDVAKRHFAITEKLIDDKEQKPLT